MSGETVDTIILMVVIGWALNFLATAVSWITDLYWKNMQVVQGLMACLAFSWVPYFVFLAGLNHFARWALGKPRR